MKKFILTLGLFSASTPLFALGCESLGITITNQTKDVCELKNVVQYSGALAKGRFPMIIPSGEMTPIFFMQQGYEGAGVQLDYRCGNKLVIFDSWQDYCGFYAGSVAGVVYKGNDLSAEFQTTFGSWWAALPGQIRWTIRNRQ